jgi:tRNA-specific 2-thiouridylase
MSRLELTGTGQAGSVECGALVKIELVVEEGVVVDAKYRAYGCPATLACASATVNLARGRSLLEVARVGEVELKDSLSLAPDKMHSAETAVDALHAALGQVLATGSDVLGGTETDSHGVLVGMSGGVDSSVAALLLKELGYHPVGATLSLWNDPHVSGDRSCCSPETVRRARRVAHGLGLPHVTLDVSATFAQRVVAYFIQSYAEGLTPNPCAKCNARVRFGHMLAVAERLGLAWVATGHYAQLLGEEPVLARGMDISKDQSYVLAEVDAAVLRRVMFPLGKMSKREVRALAVSAGLEGCRAAESQEICFIPDDDYRRFLRNRLGDRPGSIVDETGRTLGRHSGTYNYTIGQRRGLGIPSPAPLYVLRIDSEHGAVVVGGPEALAVQSVTLEQLTWHQAPPLARIDLQVRSSGEAYPGELLVEACGQEPVSGQSETVTVILEQPICAVARGQTGVVYAGDRVVCAGTITRTERAATSGERAIETAERGPVV